MFSFYWHILLVCPALLWPERCATPNTGKLEILNTVRCPHPVYTEGKKNTLEHPGTSHSVTERRSAGDILSVCVTL